MAGEKQGMLRNGDQNCQLTRREQQRLLSGSIRDKSFRFLNLFQDNKLRYSSVVNVLSCRQLAFSRGPKSSGAIPSGDSAIECIRHA
jgi:hypothetical protein